MNSICKAPYESADIGEKIRYKRLKKGLTLKELAKIVCTTDVTISRWERGIVRPNIDNVILLAKALNFSIDELAGLKNDN